MGGASTKEEKKSSGRNSVLLNIYEPKDPANRGLPAFRVYHSGVEVHGTEYVFGGGGAGLSTGIFTQRPKWMPESSPWKYKETLALGRTDQSKAEIESTIREMKIEWRNNTYDITGKNCNHFSDAFSKRLGCGSVPSWLNRAAGVGNTIRNVIGKGNKGDKKEKTAEKNAPVVDDGKHSEIKEGSIIEIVDRTKAACLNASRAHPLSSILSAPRGGIAHLESDDDEQLLIVLPFKKIVKPRAVVMYAKDKDTCPKTVKIFVNMPNLDFSDAEDAKPVAQMEVTSPKASADSKCFTIKLPAAKCNMVDVLSVFVEDNHGADSTIISRIDVIGKIA